MAQDRIRELEKQGIITYTDGVRTIDASHLESMAAGRNINLPPKKTIDKRKTISRKTEIAQEASPKREIKTGDIQKKELLEEQFSKEYIMSEEKVPKGVGLDIGTSFLVAGRFEKDGKIHFKKLRDCFLELEPKSPINKKFIQKGLDDRKAPYVEKDGKFYVLGEDAFLMSNERHVNTRRPMVRGVISPAEKEALPILRELIKRLIGEPRAKDERLVYSVPGKPIDAEFDQVFHQEILGSFIKSLGFDAHPMNEAEALAYSELLEEGLTGVAISAGGGMMNVAVLSAGDAVVNFSTSKSGDWVDQQAAIATNMTHSIVQQEKEGEGLDLMNPDPNNQIHRAIAIYYGNLIVYTLEQVAYDLRRSPSLPKFKDPVPLVVAGGTSLPKGFIAKFEQALGAVDMPVKISGVRHAADPLHAVANGLVLAASME